MISHFARRRLLLPLVLLSTSVCFAAQSNSTPAVAPNQTYTKQAEASTSGFAAFSHFLHRIRLHLGTVTIGTGYNYASGPSILPMYYSYAYPFWGYYGYAPYWGYPSWSPVFYAYPPYSAWTTPRSDEGHLKLEVEPKSAEVFINNAYAGTVAGLKGSIWLKPGVYDLCVKAPGRMEFRRRIYVLSGKKLKVLARLAPAD